MFSSRNYTVPDPPGLFDGHVWPMYVRHKETMENSGVDVGKLVFFFVVPCFFPQVMLSSLTFEMCSTELHRHVITVQLDGTKTKEQLYNAVYGDIMNNIQQCLQQ